MGLGETVIYCGLRGLFFFMLAKHAVCLVGSQFSDQGLNLGHGNESTES